MQRINKRLLMTLAAFLVISGVGLSGSALANTDNTGTTDEAALQAKEAEKKRLIEEQMRQKAEAKAKAVAEAQAKVDAKAKELAETKAKNQERRQKSCDARKANLTKQMSNSVSSAEKHKAKFDAFYLKVKAFYERKNLNVSNYEELTASVDAAEQNAAAKIAALKSLQVSVDCSQVDSLAANLTAFKEAVKSARDSLKDYRKALVSLITQLHGASTGSNDKTDDSSTNESNN